MHALILTPGLPYPMHQGGAIRNFGLIRGLHEAGHQITLLSFHDGADPLATPLADVCTRIETVPPPERAKADRLRDLFISRQPDIARRLSSDAFRAALEKLLAETRFDLVQFEGLEMASYLPIVRARQPKAKVCYDAHNAEYALQWAIFHVDRMVPKRLPAALYSMVQAQRISGFERDVCAAVDCVIAVSTEDADALRPFRPSREIAVVPNGIFADEYRNDRARLDLGKNVLVFTGKMD
jgi:polysaccharide biosynthesis protein PslH